MIKFDPRHSDCIPFPTNDFIYVRIEPDAQYKVVDFRT